MFLIVLVGLPYFEAARPTTSAPSCSQFMTCWMFPYQRRKAPPLLKGNHLRPLAFACSRFGISNPVADLLTSNQKRRKRASFDVARPWRESAIVDNSGNFVKMVRTASLIRYAIGAPGTAAKTDDCTA